MTTTTSVRHSATLDTPIGPLTVVATDAAVVEIHLPGAEGRDDPDARRASDVAVGVLAEALRQLEEYFAGERTEFDLPLAPEGTPFQQQAWEVLRTIPFGETTTYGEQARRLGDPKKSRAVGAANGRNPIPVVVPCHRVVGSDGRLTGYAGGLDTKAWLLAHEHRVRLMIATR
ncbi:MAG: methylated-DNA--[protein]-cysteine S-methyltransferase [Ilumatobacteraceae bacterium]|jgi:methylated-DNA-[protein]-cysteine S-methyltransferase|nr:methylated-DNA--[protein]-cysteine S-methyltransferase [Ilumatobacteraceae bacterium]